MRKPDMRMGRGPSTHCSAALSKSETKHRLPRGGLLDGFRYRSTHPTSYELAGYSAAGMKIEFS
jgi:hypothetical protein